MTPELMIALFLVTCSAGLYWYSFKAFRYCESEVDINSEAIDNINFLVDNNLKRIQELEKDIQELQKDLKDNYVRITPGSSNQDPVKKIAPRKTKKRNPAKNT